MGPGRSLSHPLGLSPPQGAPGRLRDPAPGPGPLNSSQLVPPHPAPINTQTPTGSGQGLLPLCIPPRGGRCLQAEGSGHDVLGRGLVLAPLQAGEGTSSPETPQPLRATHHPIQVSQGQETLGAPAVCRRATRCQVGEEEATARDLERRPRPGPSPGTLLTTELRRAGSQAGRAASLPGPGARKLAGLAKAGLGRGLGSEPQRQGMLGPGRCQGRGTWTGIVWPHCVDESGQEPHEQETARWGGKETLGSPAWRGCRAALSPKFNCPPSSPPKPALGTETGSLKWARDRGGLG